jgi:hypothetical protein
VAMPVELRLLITVTNLPETRDIGSYEGPQQWTFDGLAHIMYIQDVSAHAH